MIAYPKYRVNCWFNEVDDSVKYGVDIKTDKQSAAEAYADYLSDR